MKFPDIGGGKNQKNGGSFIKMKDGDRLKGVFRGDPHIFRQHWVGGRSQLCAGKDACDYCKSGDKPKFRFRINFLTQEDGVWLAKIFEQGYGTFKDLKEMHEQEYDLEKTSVILSRSGEGTDTRYRVMPARDNFSTAEFKKITAVPLNALSDETVAPAEEEADASEDVPF